MYKDSPTNCCSSLVAEGKSQVDVAYKFGIAISDHLTPHTFKFATLTQQYTQTPHNEYSTSPNKTAYPVQNIGKAIAPCKGYQGTW